MESYKVFAGQLYILMGNAPLAQGWSRELDIRDRVQNRNVPGMTGGATMGVRPAIVMWMDGGNGLKA